MQADIVDWFKAFYALSDDGTAAHERYTTFYADDAKLIMGDKTAVGRDEIIELRKGMWSAISSRRHTYTLYTSPEKLQTYMLEGEVAYEFQAGGEGIVRWIAKAEFEGEGAGRRLRFYQVFLNAGSK